MAFVITDNCIKDELCAQSCPVDCIHPRSEEADSSPPRRCTSNPAECIDCGACIPACTSDAIFALDDVPADKQQFIAVDEAFFAWSLVRRDCSVDGDRDSDQRRQPEREQPVGEHGDDGDVRRNSRPPKSAAIATSVTATPPGMKLARPSRSGTP